MPTHTRTREIIALLREGDRVGKIKGKIKAATNASKDTNKSYAREQIQVFRARFD